MPKIRILVPVAGTDFSWSPGDVVSVDEKTARAWCDGERAERVSERRSRRPRPPIEAAVTAPPEDTAVQSSG